LKETLVELLNMLFQRDNKTIDDIIEKFNCKEEDYTRPPENYNISELINTDCPQTNCEFVEGFYHTEETKSNGLNIKKDSIELWFKFKDVKLKRKKIFRLGDYYLRLINGGFDKWYWSFYVKMPCILNNELTTSFALAQHPHISNGNACLAGMETGIRASITNYNFNGFLWRMRTFLNSWNYRSPHHSPESFEHMGLILFDKDIRHLMFDKGDNTSCMYNYNDYFLKYNFSDKLSNEDGTDKFSAIDLKLPSARKKDYVTEPLSSVIYHTRNNLKYITGEKISTRYSEHTSYYFNIAHWIMDIIEDDSIELNQAYILAYYLDLDIVEKAKNSLNNYEGGWKDEYEKSICDWEGIIRSWKFYKSVIEKDRYSNFHSEYTVNANYYLWYLTKERDNPETGEKCEKLLNRLYCIIGNFKDIKDTIVNDYGPSSSSIRDVTQSFIKNQFKSDIAFKGANDFIQWMNNIEFDKSEAMDVEDIFQTLNNEFFEIKEILDKEFKLKQIEYYEEQLRSLKDGKERKHTVQIENLNL